MIRTYKFRLYPSRKQEDLLLQHSDLSRWLWNELLEATKKHYKDFGYFLSKQALQLMCKRYGLYAQTAQAVAHKVFNSVMRYLKSKKKGVKYGFPRFKSRHRGTQSLYYPQSGFRFQMNGKLKVSPFGAMNVRTHRDIEGEIKTLTVKRTPTGKWFVTIVSELLNKQPQPRLYNPIGVDLGVEKLATLSDGITISNPRHLRGLEERLAIQQRKLSRKVERSNNYRKQSMKVAKVHEKIKDTRNDYLHTFSTWLVNNYSHIALEDLQVNNMTKNHRLAKAISDASWGKFTDFIDYKAESAGSQVVYVNPRNTSQECSGCGNKVSKPLSQRTHSCPCGVVMDRDLNASRNILKRATLAMRGSNALRDEPIGSSVMREARIINGQLTPPFGLNRPLKALFKGGLYGFTLSI